MASITMEGRSGATYSFSVHRWGTAFRAWGAVYSVLRLRPDRDYDVLYVGETGDLSTRFDGHHRQACFDRNGVTHVAVHLESAQARRLTIETDLRERYDPPCNRQ